MKLFCLFVLLSAIFFAAVPANAATLVMFEQAGCPWCVAFDREIAPAYAKSEEGLRAPLRRVDIDQPLPPDLSFIHVERLTPLFVLIDKGREIGRIRGYPGADGFWMQLGILFERLDKNGMSGQRAHMTEKIMCAQM